MTVGGPSSRVAAIHQPNLLPWLGWFDKLDRADVFVVLDQVGLNRRSFTHRVGVLQGGAPRSLVVPVQHTGSQALPIDEARLDLSSRQLRKIAQTLRHAYGKEPHWRAVGAPIVDLLHEPPARLVDLNMGLIRHMMEQLGIDLFKLRLQSALVGRGQKSELMATLTVAAGARVYLSGGHPPGVATSTGTAADYNDPAVFATHGVELRYQGFRHPTYDQGSLPFVPGLSAVDSMVRLGGPATLAMLREARGTA